MARKLLSAIVAIVVCIVAIAMYCIFNQTLDMPIKFAYSGMSSLVGGIVCIVLHGTIATKSTRKVTLFFSSLLSTVGIAMLYVSAALMSENVRLIELVVLSLFVIIIALLLYTARRRKPQPKPSRKKTEKK